MSVKVGDKIRYTGSSEYDLTNGKVYVVSQTAGKYFYVLDDVGYTSCIIQNNYELVTDTPQAPTIFRDMTDAEKGALMLAKHQGKKIVGWVQPWGKWIVLNCSLWCDDGAYRVAEPEPEPVVEVERVTIVNAEGMTIGSGTVTTHNGKPDPDSIKMEETL